MLKDFQSLVLYSMTLACCYCSASISSSLPAGQRFRQPHPQVLDLKGGECSGKTVLEIISLSDVVLVRKGEDDSFSNRLVDILESKNVQYKAVDVSFEQHLEEMFAEATKEAQPTFSFPQLYCKGKLVVSLDMIKDLLESGDDIDEMLALQQLAGSLASAWHAGAKGGAASGKPSSSYVETMPS